MSNYMVEAAAISTLLPVIAQANPVLAKHYRQRMFLLLDAHTRLLCSGRTEKGWDPIEALALIDQQNPAREEPLPEQLRVSPASRIRVKTSFSYYPQTKEAICGMCCKQFKDLEANVVTEVMENHLLRSCTASGLSCSEQTTLEQ